MVQAGAEMLAGEGWEVVGNWRGLAPKCTVSTQRTHEPPRHNGKSLFFTFLWLICCNGPVLLS